MAGDLAPALRDGRISLTTAARRVWMDERLAEGTLELPLPISASEVMERDRVFRRRTTAAYDAIDDFDASTHRGVWPKLQKTEIIHGLRRRVLEPWRVDQGPTPFCGPAAIAYELAQRDPRRYVAIVRHLFETGGFVDRRRKRIAASRSLRTFPPHGEITEANGDKFFWQVPHVDWILLATLREEANLLLGVTGGFGGANALKGATTAWEVVEWSKRILGASSARIHRAKPAGEFGIEPGVLDAGITDAWAWMRNHFRRRDVGAEPVLRAAVRAVEDGGFAILMVNARLLTRPTSPILLTTLAPNVATHWVAMVTGGVDLRRLNEATSPITWSREVARHRLGTHSNNFTWVRPVTQLGPGNHLRLSAFTWETIENRRTRLADLRRHLFAAVVAS